MLESFLKWLYDKGKDEKTIKAYRSTINQFIKWYEETEGHTDL